MHQETKKTFLKRSVLGFVFLALNIGSSLQAQTPVENGNLFSIAIIPDTQYYTSEKRGGKPEMFNAQTKWIVDNADKEKIAYVIHLGDISDDGEKFPQQWVHASQAMYALDKPIPGYPKGIPYGLTVGNHDQTKSQYPLTGKTDQYNKYFGIDHFKDKPWYGGHYGSNNDSHYDLFTAAGVKFIAIYFEYDSYDEDIENLNNWAAGLLEKHSDRKAILISHSILHFNKTAGTNYKAFPSFSKQGKRVFDRLKHYPNVMLTLSGHVGDHGEGYRQDGQAGNIIKSLLTDYQSRENGGHGLMRLMTFDKNRDLVLMRTFSPYTGEEETDGDSKFTMPWLKQTNSARYMDYDNNQLTDIIEFKSGNWTLNKRETRFGQDGDIPVPADYNGDGKIELAVYRSSEGKFYQEQKEPVALGKPGDIPVVGDYDGDGFADFAVYNPETMNWHIHDQKVVKHGAKGVIPVPADYDGDGLTDLGFFNPANSFWQVAGLGNIPLEVKHTPGDIPVPADYDGDGRVNMAIFRPSTGEWLIDRVASVIKFGQPGDIPVPGNYKTGGKSIPAVLRNGKIILQDGTVIDSGSLDASTLVNIPIHVRRRIDKN